MLHNTIDKLILFPTTSAQGDPVYEILGDIHLFALERPANTRVSLADLSTQIYQQYEELRISFTGVLIHPRTDYHLAA